MTDKRITCQVCQETIASTHICASCVDKFLPKEVGIAQIQRNYVDLALLVEAIKLHNQSTTTNKIHYDIETINNKPVKLALSFDLYATNPLGTYIGDESYEAIFKTVPKYHLEQNEMHNHEYSRWIIWIDDANFECTNAPESETCDCADKENCQCELYYSALEDDADIDYAYQEFDHLLDQVLKTPLMWSSNKNVWQIINRNTKEIVWRPRDE